MTRSVCYGHACRIVHPAIMKFRGPASVGRGEPVAASGGSCQPIGDRPCPRLSAHGAVPRMEQSHA
eukprot:1851452-Prymnesium_polylepis.2